MKIKHYLSYILFCLLVGLFPAAGLLAETQVNKYGSLKKQLEESPAPAYYRSVKERKLPVTPEALPKEISPAAVSQEDEDFARLEDSARQGKNELNIVRKFSGLDETSWQEAAKAKEDLGLLKELLAKELDVELLVALSVYRNPGLKAALLRKKAAINEYSQAMNLQEILTQYVSFAEALNTRVGPKQHKPMIGMLYPYPGMMSLRGEIIDLAVAIEENKYLIKARDLAARVKKSYYQLAYLVQEENISSETLELLKAMKEISQSLYRTAKASFNDVINIQMKIDTLDERLVTIKDKQTAAKAQIRRDLDLPPQFELGTPPQQGEQTVAYQLKSLWQKGEENNFEIITMKLKLEKMKQMILMMEKMFYPDYASKSGDFENQEALMLGSGKVKQPFSPRQQPLKAWYGKNDAYIRELKDQYAAMQQKLNDLEIDLRRKIEQTLLKIEEAKRKTVLFKGVLIPQVDQSLEVSQIGYQSGKVGFSDLLRAYNSWLDYHLKYHLATKKGNSNIAELERLTSLNISKKGEVK